MEQTNIIQMRNSHGIHINICCASCQHKSHDYEGNRLCEPTQVMVPQDFHCPLWEAEKRFQNAGRSGGKVKRREYLQFVRDIQLQKQAAADEGQLQPEDLTTMADLRAQFEKETGMSPYIIR